ncbi:DUF3892 domain-containing protein [Clostridium fungisolvens]|uniref:DUF3892 domain-containing protein n=1 Tax=Clostridium fungisolvens TaxID=1604897 RepID=A0A6V8SH63_9CLOT|nr:DUF3892 domain-containing protein [Clostridium fungisolvens]GFP76554.1 hypothetical protein bsdtw1_02657 [Clostridium fungisolvens]
MPIDKNLAHTIAKIIKDEDDQIILYELDNGEKISTGEAVMFAKQGVLKDVEIAKAKNGSEYLKCVSEDGSEPNNISETHLKRDEQDSRQFFQ